MYLSGIEFRPVKGFEECYEVSADGAVFSKITNRFRTAVINDKTGYPTMVLVHPGGKKQTKCLHRIVAETWIENPDNLECVNHKNENKLDNHVSNLEWCTKYYNNTYNGKTQRPCKKIIQINPLTNEVVGHWASARAASKETLANYKNISAVLRGNRKTAGGFRWEFDKE